MDFERLRVVESKPDPNLWALAYPEIRKEIGAALKQQYDQLPRGLPQRLLMLMMQIIDQGGREGQSRCAALTERSRCLPS
jgi:hypothetical protein